MEFYALNVRGFVTKFESFNSQRDGILPRKQPTKNSRHIVSIPNGMEFYRGELRQQAQLSKVSIPNGMEFYLMPLPSNVKYVVSIPNGMEFYEE